MAIVFVTLSDSTGSMDYQFHREYTRVFKVILDNPLDSDLSILLSGLVPLVNSSHPGDLQALAQKPQVTVPDANDPTLRLVTVPYSTRTSDPDRQNKDPNESPIMKPPLSRWTHVVGTRLFTVTADTTSVRTIVKGVDGPAAVFANIKGAPAGSEGWPVQNTAGTPYDQTPETEERRLKLTVTRNEMSYDPIKADSYLDTTNQALFLGKFGPGTARCVQFDGERAYEKNVGYYVVTYGWEFASDWDIILRDYGPHGIDQSGGSGNYKEVKRVATNGVTAPFPNLDGNGALLADDSSPVYLGFRRFPRMNFDLLNITNL